MIGRPTCSCNRRSSHFVATNRGPRLSSTRAPGSPGVHNLMLGRADGVAVGFALGELHPTHVPRRRGRLQRGGPSARGSSHCPPFDDLGRANWASVCHGGAIGAGAGDPKWAGGPLTAPETVQGLPAAVGTGETLKICSFGM